MPLDPTGVISAGADILSAGIGAITQASQNKKDRNFAREMYARQRADALADYAMQNEYNSPASQMERLKAAGLNPNLVYGNGATTTSASVRSSSPPGAQGTAPKVNLSGIVSGYLDAKIKQAQIDNLKAQNSVLLEQSKNIAADTISKGFEANNKEFDFNWKTDMRNLNEYKLQQSNINAYKHGNLTDAQIANTNARTQTENTMRSLNASARSAGISETLQRVINLRLQAAKTSAEVQYIQQHIQNAIKDGKLKDIDIRMKRYGVSWSDPAWQRKILQLFNEGLDL